MKRILVIHVLCLPIPPPLVMSAAAKLQGGDLQYVNYNQGPLSLPPTFSHLSLFCGGVGGGGRHTSAGVGVGGGGR